MPPPHTAEMTIFDQAAVAAALGQRAEWSDELHYWSSRLLQSSQPTFLVWGRELTVLFNDAYRAAMEFPDFSVLGISLPRLCDDLWPQVEPFVRDAFSGGSGYLYNREFRRAFPGSKEGSNFHLSYSAIRHETRPEVLGVVCILVESDAGRHFPAHDQQPVCLTARQKDCLWWVKQGKSSAAIAGILGISVHTVDEHIADACKRLGVRTRVQAAVEASLHGFFN